MMGQQQLLYLTVTIIIVGFASFIGIHAFHQNEAEASAEAMVQDIVRIAAHAQSWKQLPTDFGGQPDTTLAQRAAKEDEANFTGVSFTVLGYEQAPGFRYESEHGTYRLTAGKPLVIEGFNALQHTYVRFEVRGVTEADVFQTELVLGTSPLDTL